MTGTRPVAIVTGASRGIGRCIAVDLVGDGYDLVVAAKTETAHASLPGTIHDAARAIEEAGGRALAVRADVRDEKALERIVERTLEHFGRIDVLVNNAGALWWRPVLETPPRRYDLVMDVNARAAFLLSRLVAAAMIDAGRGGHIVMMSPPLDTRPLPGMVAYAMSKLGMTMAALGMAEELRSARIAVNALWPATMVESQATIGWKLGAPGEWRTPAILSDALRAILASDPAELTGRALIDEDFLRERGETDFSRYRVVADSEPPRVGFDEIPGLIARAREPGENG